MVSKFVDFNPVEFIFNTWNWKACAIDCKNPQKIYGVNYPDLNRLWMKFTRNLQPPWQHLTLALVNRTVKHLEEPWLQYLEGSRLPHRSRYLIWQLSTTRTTIHKKLTSESEVKWKWRGWWGWGEFKTPAMTGKVERE